MPKSRRSSGGSGKGKTRESLKKFSKAARQHKITFPRSEVTRHANLVGVALRAGADLEGVESSIQYLENARADMIRVNRRLQRWRRTHQQEEGPLPPGEETACGVMEQSLRDLNERLREVAARRGRN